MYPNCDTGVTGSFYSPLFVAVGAADDWMPTQTCKSLTNYPTVSGTTVDISMGALVRLIVYPDVTHAFDIPGPTSPQYNNFGYRIAYSPSTVSDLQPRMRAFLDSLLK
jgi:dienelactone hydrolase